MGAVIVYYFFGRRFGRVGYQYLDALGVFVYFFGRFGRWGLQYLDDLGGKEKNIRAATK